MRTWYRLAAPCKTLLYNISLIFIAHAHREPQETNTKPMDILEHKGMLLRIVQYYCYRYSEAVLARQCLDSRL